jgi:hypothetical protein
VNNQGFLLSRVWFYILSFTWGCLLTVPGCLTTLILIICGYRPKPNAYGWYIEIGETWGGFNSGPCSLVCKNPSKYLLQHEFGHSIQNCIFGPFIIPFIVIPSICRYWYRIIIVNWLKKPQNELPDYYDIWFERSASELGALYAPLD